MTGILEIREKLKLIYSKFEALLVPLMKFIVAFAVLNTVNGRMGYMTQLDNIAIVLIVALMCSFLPTGCIVLFGALFSLLHMYALSLEVLLVGFCVYLVMFLLYLRFAPKDSLVVVLLPLLFTWKIPYVVPIAAGLLCGPTSVVSVGCGVCVYYLLHTVTSSASAINTMADSEATAKIRLVVDGIIGNKGMIVVIAAFAITVLVVYFIRRMSIDYAWTIAMIAGVMTNIVILLIGDLIYDTNISVAGALLGSLLALAAGKVIEFFRFCVDYSRTEKVQFEDDEYYYYVKAVPKMSVSVSTKTVKKINTQRSRGSVPAGRGSAQGQGRTAARSQTAERSVMTERTVAGSRGAYGASDRQTSGRTPVRSGGRSVTIGRTAREELPPENTDDYEELF